jgi:hypothetical protein
MNPAEMLEGMRLEGEWMVVEKVVRSRMRPGGFSPQVTECVTRMGARGF